MYQQKESNLKSQEESHFHISSQYYQTNPNGLSYAFESQIKSSR
jgi:hypothetical protein